MLKRKDRALKYLLECDTLTEASAKAGISRKTLYNYINTDEQFSAAFRDLQRRNYIALSDEIIEYKKELMQELKRMALDRDNVAPRDRIAACRALLAYYTDIEQQGKTAIEVQEEKDAEMWKL